MNRTVLRHFSVWARKELLAAGEHRNVEHKEEAAQRWFFHLIALRFVTVNHYLPSRCEELSFASAKELSFLLPEFFAKYDSSWFFPFEEGKAVAEALVRDIPVSYFDLKQQGQVEILGWLFQYFNADVKDETFALLKKNVKITKERVPSVTQLFTPHWIVRYLVENSLGRLWAENRDDFSRSRWEYYIDREDSVLGDSVSPEEIRFIDPCMGSGNILLYAFDLLMDIYLSQGYAPADAVKLILEKNLCGLDIDEEAATLTSFALRMKARQYDPDAFLKKYRLRVFAVRESNGVSRDFSNCGASLNEDEKQVAHKQLRELLDAFSDAKEYGSLLCVPPVDIELLHRFLGEDLAEHREVRYIIDVAEILTARYHVAVTNPPYMGINGMDAKLASFVKKHYPHSKTDLFSVFIERCSAFTSESGYFALITQPSLLFLSSFEKLRKKLLEENTLLSLLHLGRGIFGVDFGSAAFVFRRGLSKETVGSYFRLHERNFQYLDPDDIAKLFRCALSDGDFHFDFRGYDTKTGIDEISSCSDTAISIRFERNQRDFLQLPGAPFGYWVSDQLLQAFATGIPLGKIAAPRQGLATTDNDKYLRFWYEVDHKTVFRDMASKEEAAASEGKWFPYNKGGEYRKWYGNDEYIVNYENDGAAIKADVLRKYPYLKTPDFVVKNTDYYFRPCFTWSLISSGIASFRYKPQGYLFDVAGMSCFAEEHFWYLLGLCNSVVASKILEIIAPTINYQCGDIAAIPVIFDETYETEIEALVKENIALAKDDWDASELSVDFKKHPLIRGASLKDSFDLYRSECELRFEKLKENEETLNRIFLKIYGLENEISPRVQDHHISVRKADLTRDIKSLISYGVGCLLGRYSADKDGVLSVDGAGEHRCFLPVTDTLIFEDDIVALFCDWLESVFGKDSLEENLALIASALGENEISGRDALRRYFLYDFIKDHIKLYRKRPIYWLMESGKQKGFSALVAMHRWEPSIYAGVKEEYLAPLVKFYRKAASARKGETATEKRKQEKAKKQLEEIALLSQKLDALANSHISVHLDDGVKVNYIKVQTDEHGVFHGILKKI